MGVKENNMEDNSCFTIGEVVKLTGVSKDKIRYYEEKGLLRPMQSGDNRYRYYSEQDMDKVLAIEFYRSVDLGIPEMEKILYKSDLGEICSIISDKRRSLEEEIKRLENINENLQNLEESYIEIRDGLWEITVKPMPPFRILGEIEDYRSYQEYSKLHAMKDVQLPVFRKMKRHIVLSDVGLVSNKMVLTEEVADATEPNVIKHDTCVHMLLQDGPEAGNIIAETYGKVREWCEVSGWRLRGEAYIGMLLVSEKAGQIRSYLELYGPVVRTNKTE